MDHRLLRLRGVDSDDLKVISAHLQDSIMTLGDISYHPEEGCFLLGVNRFKWETMGVSDGFERTRCGVRIDGVVAARCRNIDQRDRRQVLSLLCIALEEEALMLHFSGGGCIRLEVGPWLCHVEDLGDPWPTSRCPLHEGETGEGGVVSERPRAYSRAGRP